MTERERLVEILKNAEDCLDYETMADYLLENGIQINKKYNNHEVACILADFFGDNCACNYNGIDKWLPYYCDFAEKECPDVVGVACWEQYLKHLKEREK